jgi:hypothetical protein
MWTIHLRRYESKYQDNINMIEIGVGDMKSLRIVWLIHVLFNDFF